VTVDIGAVAQAHSVEMIKQAQKKRDVGIGSDRQMQIGGFRRHGTARIDDHDLGAAPLARGKEALEQDGVAPRHVGADENDEIGLLQILIGARHGIGPEGADVACH
jgi:IMP dehydrogenase/GMP reductase